MKSTITNTTNTTVLIEIIAEQSELDAVKATTLKRVGKDVKVPGFREGKAPAELIEKHVNRDILLNEFLDDAMSRLFAEAVTDHKLRPVTRPQAEMKKFVPFTELEFSVTVEVVPPIKLADYKKMKKTKPVAKVETSEVNKVLENLQLRMATKEDVERAAKETDQVWIDFDGTDAKGAAVAGASGKDYPLALGSKTFIPGFEENLVGVKKGDEKEFTLEFPKDYGVKALQGQKVTFKVKVNKVQSVTQPKLDDVFAKEVGPFTSLEELKADITKQLESERKVEVEKQFQNEIIEDIIEKTDIELPKSIIESYEQELDIDLKQNLTYRGITYPEYLEQTAQTEEEHRAREITPLAEKRAKAGLILTEIADVEKITISEDEVKTRIELLKGQYQDPKMQEQLNSPDAKRDIAAQLLSEKTIIRLSEIVQANAK